MQDEIIIDCDVNIHELDSFDILLRLILNAQRQPLLNQIPFWSVELITPKEKDKKSKKKFNRNEIQFFSWADLRQNEKKDFQLRWGMKRLEGKVAAKVKPEWGWMDEVISEGETAIRMRVKPRLKWGWIRV